MHMKTFGFVWRASGRLPSDAMKKLSECLNWEGGTGGDTGYPRGVRLRALRISSQ